MRKKNSFTLIEVLISLSLISVLLIFLFHFFTQITIYDKKIEEAKTYVYSKHHLYVRLNQMFSELIRAKHFSETDTTFTTQIDKYKHFVFHLVFDNHIDPDPDFSGPVQATLSLEDKNLVVVLKPTNSKKKKQRKEVLLSDVKSMDFEFLKMDEKDVKKIKWESIWPEKMQTIPPMIKVSFSLLDQKNTLSYVFFLSSIEDKIVYREKKQ